jgi:hypothetical protein
MYSIAELELILKPYQDIIRVSMNGLYTDKEFIINKNVFIDDFERLQTDILNLDSESMDFKSNGRMYTITFEDFEIDEGFIL